MFEHLLESSHRDDSNKWSNIGFGEEILQALSIEFNYTHIIWSSTVMCTTNPEYTYSCVQRIQNTHTPVYKESRIHILQLL